MDVFVANEQHLPLDEARLSELARHTLAAEDLDEEAELSVLCVTKDHIRQLNKRFAGNDHATDVLAFPMMDEDEEEAAGLLLGDVVVCPEVAAENASRLGHGMTRELDTLLVHGTLHLLGYDHQGVEDRDKMDKRIHDVLGSYRPPAS